MSKEIDRFRGRRAGWMERAFLTPPLKNEVRRVVPGERGFHDPWHFIALVNR